jgi:hypothetical protein
LFELVMLILTTAGAEKLNDETLAIVLESKETLDFYFHFFAPKGVKFFAWQQIIFLNQIKTLCLFSA